MIDTIIDEWFTRTIKETVVMTDGNLYNKFYAAKEELKALLSPAAPLASSEESQPEENENKE